MVCLTQLKVLSGFINIKVSAGYLSDYLNKMSEDDKYGYENSEEAKTVIVDYGELMQPSH